MNLEVKHSIHEAKTGKFEGENNQFKNNSWRLQFSVLYDS